MVSKGGDVAVSPAAPRQTVLYLLTSSGLMVDPAQSDPSSKGKQRAISADRLQITSRGFQFLLEDVTVQQWDLMLHYLRLAPVSRDSPRRMYQADSIWILSLSGSRDGRHRGPAVPVHAGQSRARSREFLFSLIISVEG